MFLWWDYARPEMSQGPSAPNGIGNCSIHGETTCPQTLEQQSQHGFFAAKEVSGAGDVENEIAVGDDVGVYRDKRTGIGMPVRELREHMPDEAVVDFPSYEVGDEGAGIRKVLAGMKLPARSPCIHCYQPHRAFLLFPQGERPCARLQGRISPL